MGSARRLVWIALAAVGCGPPTSVVRPTDSTVYLKIKGELAQELFDELAGVPEPVACPADGEGCKRQGEHVICSTANVRDPVVCEVRLDAVGGGLLGSSAELYHSAEANRFGVEVARTEGELVLSGEGADELRRRFAPGTDGPVGLAVVDAGRGELESPTW